MATKSLDQRIVRTPDICGGKPRIAGHRITVQNIAIWHDRLGWSADEIASEYGLELADIYAGLAFGPQGRSIGELVRGLTLIAEEMEAEEMEGHVEFL